MPISNDILPVLSTAAISIVDEAFCSSCFLTGYCGTSPVFCFINYRNGKKITDIFIIRFTD